MKQIPFNITRVVVVQSSGTDKVLIETDGEPTLFGETCLCLRVEVKAGGGPEWVRSKLGIEPEVVNAGRGW